MTNQALSPILWALNHFFIVTKGGQSEKMSVLVWSQNWYIIGIECETPLYPHFQSL